MPKGTSPLSCHDFEFEIKSLDEEGVFEGKLAVYGNVDLIGDVIEPGAFTKTLSERGSSVPLLWDHDLSTPIGSLELTDGASALMAKGKLLIHDVPKAREVYALMKAGVVRGLSIGYRALKAKSVGSVRHLKELALFEGSLTVVPMNPEALVTAVKHEDLSLEQADEGTLPEPPSTPVQAETKDAEPIFDHSLLESISQLLRN
jgi:HK97 family phage prohead protease